MATRHTNRLLLLALVGSLLCNLGLLAQAQSPQGSPSQTPTSTKAPSENSDSPAPDADAAPAVFPHSESSRFWISGQINIIFQWHPSFHAAYTGPQSLRPTAEHAASRVLTLYTGAQLTHSTEILFDLESAQGRGISDAFGLAGFTNLDVVRNPALGAKPYMARLMLHQIIPLSHERVAATRGPLALSTTLPARRRLELRLGKFGMADFFDLNAVGSDSHLQFLNWTVDNNGGYDYAADTRGYTFGAILEYQDRRWGVRFAEALMPKVANGIDFEWNLRRAHAENIEAEFRGHFLPHRESALRLLGYVNHANMGVYRAAIDEFRAGAALALNAISGDHRRYLALGGRGFLLGDGRLNYGREVIFEGYYTAHFL